MDSIDLRKVEVLARKAIEDGYGTDEGEFGSNLFVFHHLEELEPKYWAEYFGSEKPEPLNILKGLVLKPIDAKDDLEGLDFTLPGEVTDYVLAVYLDENQLIEEISMES